MIDQVRIALWVLAVMANLTALQRLFAVWQRFRDEGVVPAAQPTGEER